MVVAKPETFGDGTAMVVAKAPETFGTDMSSNKKRKRAKAADKGKKKGKGPDGNPQKRMTWTNKQRALVFSTRGITFHARHLMNDIKVLMPHSKSDSKLERKEGLYAINEICEMKNCNMSMFFEMRKKLDLYMWLSMVPNGPSARFLVQNVHTMDELRLTGNHLKGSRPLVTFNKAFDDQPHLALLKEMLKQMFGTPNLHPKSKPFFDHVIGFTFLDDRIWFRNFQITDEEKGGLVEVGPRFCLWVIKVFNGSFSGDVLYENPAYKSPNAYRTEMKFAAANRYKAKAEKNARKAAVENVPKEDELDEIFHTITQDELKKAG